MSGLALAVDGLAAVEVAELSDAALSAGLVELRRLINRLEGQFQRRLEVFRTRGVAEQSGSLSTASWVTQHCHLDPTDATARTRLAQRLAGMPLVEAQLEAGEISVGHARVIGTAVADVPDERKAWAEKVLSDAAPHLEPLALDRLAQRLRYELDPEGADERAKRQHNSRRLSVATTFGGMVSVNGILDPLAGATVQSALNAFMAPVAGDERTMPQKRADALTEICRRILTTSQAPKTGGRRPQIMVRTDLTSLSGQPGATAAELWVGPITGETARQIACDAEVIRIITAGASEILDVGRATRTFPPAIRRALLAQWATCFWPGCSAPAEWSEGHHIIHWLFGGETSATNAALPCTHHHHVIHRDDWQLEKNSPRAPPPPPPDNQGHGYQTHPVRRGGLAGGGGPALERLPPRPVVAVPRDRHGDAVLEAHPRLVAEPAELAVVERVAPVVPLRSST